MFVPVLNFLLLKFPNDCLWEFKIPYLSSYFLFLFEFYTYFLSLACGIWHISDFYSRIFKLFNFSYTINFYYSSSNCPICSTYIFSQILPIHWNGMSTTMFVDINTRGYACPNNTKGYVVMTLLTLASYRIFTKDTIPRRVIWFAISYLSILKNLFFIFCSLSFARSYFVSQ